MKNPVIELNDFWKFGFDISAESGVLKELNSLASLVADRLYKEIELSLENQLEKAVNYAILHELQFFLIDDGIHVFFGEELVDPVAVIPYADFCKQAEDSDPSEDIKKVIRIIDYLPED